MSGGRPASVDGPLLARKGDAVPAIPDQSPLGFQLDHDQAELHSRPREQDGKKNASAGITRRVKSRLRLVSARNGKKSSRMRWTAVIVGALFVGAAIWLSTGSENSLPATAEVSPASVAVAENVVLPLNLPPPPPQPPVQLEDPAIIPDPPLVNAALPASVAFAVSETSDDEVKLSNLGITSPQSAPIIPVNIPSSEQAPEIGGVDPVPDVAPNLPKSVSPIPVPRAKPDVSSVPASGRYAVQLASIAIEKRAGQEAFRLQKQLGHILGAHKIEIEKALVDGKGTMYRLRAGGYKTQAEANSACARVVQLKVNCLALRR